MIINILKANKMIEDLTSQVSVLQEKLETAGPSPEAMEKLEKKIEKMKKASDNRDDEIKEYQVSLEKMASLTSDLEESIKNGNKFKETSNALLVELDNLKKTSKEEYNSMEALYKAELDTLNKQISDFKNQLEAKTTSVNRQVAEQMASLGVEEGKIPTAKEITPVDILTTFRALTGLEQQKFYTEHKDTLLKAESELRRI